jgi:16S rRNA (uracil1498-N3)-methyltransferase
MSEPRFYCPRLTTGAVRLDEAESRHALRSRRLRAGDAVTLFDGCGRVGHGRITEGLRRASRSSLAAEVSVDAILTVPAPTRRLTLIPAACKGSRLDWMIEKCTELGATRMVLADFEHSVVRLQPRAVAGLMATAIAACKQSRRAWLPQIIVAQSLPAALASAAAGADDLSDALASPDGDPPSCSQGPVSGTRRQIEPPASPLRGRSGRNPVAFPAPHEALLIADPDETAPHVAAWLHGRGPMLHRLTAVVGPEGGLTETERDLLRRAGGQLVRLAEHVLRIETAAVSIAANWAARG